ncbi:MAG: hypothetical protein RBS78_00940 [Coriobacteriia bacterium]|jgi:hypothetical protein|nr:hypothetical protein [Coriobacteriia bacterium]
MTMRSEALEEFTHAMTMEVQASRPGLPYVFVCGMHEAAVEFCRSRGVHPSLFKPVVCWPNLAGYGIKHRYKLWLVRGYSQVEDIDRIIRRAKSFGFEVKYA